MPKISVIMGVHNCKDKTLLRKSVDSIIHQTFEDWEFLICNDGSTDDTLETLHTIAQLDSRIRVLSYPDNQGLAYALNTCVTEAKGMYFARQDDDDVSLPQRLEKQYAIMEEHPEYAFAGTIADVIDADGTIWGEYLLEEEPVKKSFLWNNPFIHPTVMIRPEALKKAGGYRVAKETRRCEDYDLFMRMYAMGYRGYNLQEKLYQYRIINNPNQKYRPMKYRLDEAKVRWIGYQKMGMLLIGLPYIFKPILIGLIPKRIFAKIRKRQY